MIATTAKAPTLVLPRGDSAAVALALLLTSAWPVAGAAQRAGAVSERLRGQEIAATSPPLDHPECRPAAEANHMRDEDPVLGVVVEGRARAYPWWVLKNYHVVNDTIGRTALAVSLCEQCSGGAAFRRELHGRTLSLRVAGVYNGTIVLQDRETGTLFSPFGGRGLEGPLAGRKLERLPLIFTHWDEWVARHPDTDVVFARPALRGGHGAWYSPGKWGIVSEMGSTIVDFDPRLPENAVVYGVESGQGKAYPLGEVRARGGVVNDAVGPLAVVIVARGSLEAAGFERRLDGRVLTFRASREPPGVMVDEETGSRWSIEGEALAGALRTKHLAPLDGYTVEWHVWSAYNPRAEVLETTATRAPSPTTLPGEPPGFPALVLAGALGDAPPRALRLDGELNLVVLFAAWCPPCRIEMPRLQRLVDEYASSGLRAAGIAVHLPEDLEREAVRRFLAEAKITFPTFLVDDAAYPELEDLARGMGGSGLVLPMVFVIDRRQRVLAVHRGRDLETLPETVKKLLGQASASRMR
jgi:thiol-disulfide isomerase/thioredoxin